MKGPKVLYAAENSWHTQMGLAFPGERVVFRGKDLFHELKDMRWMELLLYGITGRSFSDKQLCLFEGIWVLCTSYPDPRIWNNRICSLSGTARSTTALGISASIAVSEAKIYGGQPVIKSIDFLIGTQKKLNEGVDLQKLISNELNKNRGIAGYARPLVRINQIDERIDPLLKLANELSFSHGPYVKLAFEIEKCLLDGRWRMRMNIAALIAALVADQGLSAQDYYRYMVLCFTAGMFPCYIEAAERKEGIFLPLSCNNINYVGEKCRQWPSPSSN